VYPGELDQTRVRVADHYLRRGAPPSHRYSSPGMQPIPLRDLPAAAIYTNGFNPLRNVGIEYASKLDEAGNQVVCHFDKLPHGFL